jgi:hypothetical protein
MHGMISIKFPPWASKLDVACQNNGCLTQYRIKGTVLITLNPILCSLLQVPTSLTSVAQTVGFKCKEKLKIWGIYIWGTSLPCCWCASSYQNIKCDKNLTYCVCCVCVCVCVFVCVCVCVHVLWEISRIARTLYHDHTIARTLYHIHTKLNSMALVRERTIPTERPPPVEEVITQCKQIYLQLTPTIKVSNTEKMPTWDTYLSSLFPHLH